MRRYKIAKIVLPIGLDKEFDYLIPPAITLRRGMRAEVEFRKEKKIGIAVGFKDLSPHMILKPILNVLDNSPILNEDNIRFATYLSKIYPYALGEFLFMMLPPYLKKIKKLSTIEEVPIEDFTFSLHKRRSNPILFIKANTFSERYSLWREKINKSLKSGSTLICFPQLSYLNEAKKILRKDFSDLIIIHSQQKEKELYLNWMKSRKRSLILGTRVSLFYYPSDVNLIIVEDENNPCYFQEEKPFYHLLDIAFALHRIKSFTLVLSGDYPSLQTYNLIKMKKVRMIEENKYVPNIKVVNIEGYKKKVISPILGELLRKNMENNKRVVLIWNKKGFAPILSCSACGYTYKCDSCSGFLRLSLKENEGVCPYCGKKKVIPNVCKECKKGYIKSLGVGVERLAMILKRFFPDIRIDRWEDKTSDTRIAVSTSKILTHLYEEKEFDIGFVLDVDFLLSRLDYEATFSTFLYLQKLALFFPEGIYVFTRNKSHYFFDSLERSWRGFYGRELSLRKKLELPPFGFVAKIVLRAKDKNKLLMKSEALYNKLKERGVFVYGPFEEHPFKLRDRYRYSVIVKSRRNYLLRKVIKNEIQNLRHSHFKLAVIIR
jgi:primosomal protein N' (replication factor Y)